MQFSGDPAGALPLNEQALTIARANHNTFLAARALQELGANAMLQGDVVRARTLFKRALVLYRRAGSKTREAKILTSLGRQAWRLGDLDTAREFAEQALAIARPLQSAWFVIDPLILLGECFSVQGKLAPARAALEEALIVAEHISDHINRGLCLQSLGHVALRQGRRGEAQALFSESLRLWWALGQQAFVVGSLDRHAAIAASRGQRERALRLTGAASGLRARSRLAVPPPVLSLRNEWFVEVRKVLSDDRIAALLSAGEMMTDHEAVAYALQPLEAQASDDTEASWSPRTSREQQVARLVARGFTNRQIAAEPLAQVMNAQAPAVGASSGEAPVTSGPGASHGLTARELEVLRLVASGRSNREIAEELILSVRTVERHVTNLYAKIGARGKADATAYAFRHRLT
jgi:DNA-binding NarL/FixJ family response regulator